MALFAGGRGANRGTGLRARGSDRGRGRGRGRGLGKKAAGNFPKRPAFNPTRVDEPVENQSNDDEASSEVDEEGIDDVSDSSSQEETLTEPNVKPYNILLQSLKANVSLAQPPRKKRRIEGEHSGGSITWTDAVKKPDIDSKLAEDVDRVDELEDENSGREENDDPVESDENEDWVRDASAEKWSSRKTTYDDAWEGVNFVPDALSELESKANHKIKTIEDFQLKQKLEIQTEKLLTNLSSLNRDLSSVIFKYKDLLFYDRTSQNGESLRRLTCLHALNHIFKTRDKVIKNNARLAKENGQDGTELRDQGFTRPKVLLILPTRQACVKAVDAIVLLCQPEQQENRKRFQDSYIQIDDNFSADKPEDFRELFAGNDDDMFRLGMKFTRKTIKYFAQFYNSDIILGSPLGLRMAMGTEGAKKQDHDFLSSIELVIVDQTDAILMQNWEHVEYIFEHLNQQPKEAHGCDFSRVRNWYLDGNARFLRQTIVFSAFNNPELNRLFSQRMQNISGKVKFGKARYDGAMLDLGFQLKQTFSRCDVPSPAADPEVKFKYFTTSVVPALSKYSKTASGGSQGVLIFIPSYMDFVRIRNHLANSSSTQNLSFGSISEYTSVRDVARARSHFFSGRHSVLLYTGRAHHFRRYHLRGVKKVVMYGLPENPTFYKEIAGSYLAESISGGKLDATEATVRSMFSKWDILKLERIVGTQRSSAMLKEKGDVFDFL